jgi:hypothetical protein
MTTRNIGSEVWRYSLPVVCLFALWLFADGSGSGRPLTPYPGGKPTSLQQVEQLRERASRECAVVEVKVMGKQRLRTGYRVGFAYVAPDQPMPTPVFSLAGVNEAGSSLAVSLAEIEALRLVRIDGSVAVLAVSQFPAITPAELMRLNPSYRQLAEHFTRKLTLRIALVRGQGTLSLIGTDWTRSTDYHVILPIKLLVPGSPVEFDSRVAAKEHGEMGPWWAIKSVISDSYYPNRFREFSKM